MWKLTGPGNLFPFMVLLSVVAPLVCLVIGFVDGRRKPRRPASRAGAAAKLLLVLAPLSVLVVVCMNAFLSELMLRVVAVLGLGSGFAGSALFMVVWLCAAARPTRQRRILRATRPANPPDGSDAATPSEGGGRETE